MSCLSARLEAFVQAPPAERNAPLLCWMGFVGAVTPPRPRRAEVSNTMAVVPADESPLRRTIWNVPGVALSGPKTTMRPPPEVEL